MEIEHNSLKRCYFLQYLYKRITEIHDEVLEHENSHPKCDICSEDTNELSFIKNQLFLIVRINFQPKDEEAIVDEEYERKSEPTSSACNEGSYEITKEESQHSSADSGGCSPSFVDVIEKQQDELQTDLHNYTRKRDRRSKGISDKQTHNNRTSAETKSTLSSFEKTSDYQCEHCEKMFSRKSSLILHIKSHLKKINATKRSKNPEAFNDNDDTEDEGRNSGKQKCAFCHKVYKRKHSCKLIEPKVRTSFPCAYCPEIFSIYPKIYQHHKINHPDKPKPISPYQCEICGAFALRIYALKRHMATHTDYAPFACDVCQKKFRTRQHLEEHKRKHIPKAERDDKYKCDVCQKKFTFRQSLVKHKNLQHTGNRKLYPCNFCGGNFISEISLQKHQTSHEGEAPRAHKCDQCGRIFDKLKYLNHHRKIQHNIFTDLMLKPKTKKK